ncbi:gamma-butyrobetaine dioxygenase-like isoform X2 [Clavelina lepadiformis]|uniref:gamma-butyrobetaine dioxygenase-like isoform X2 n=1 Tax=Clavelina lepadiformis TaxID=159417 RepID=UPI00404222FF
MDAESTDVGRGCSEAKNMFKISNIETSFARNFIEIKWKDDHSSRYHNHWMRFNCHCPKCFRVIVGQQRINCSLFPDEFPILHVHEDEEKAEIHLNYKGEVFTDHETILPLEWLRNHCYCDRCLSNMIEERQMKFALPSKDGLRPLHYDSIKDSKEGLFRVLQRVMEDGICYVKGVPVKEQFLLDFAESIGPLVDSTYGKYFKIQDLGSTDSITDTREFLTFHTDQAHYESELGVQFFHCLRFDEEVEGGESIIADMFQAAEILRKESPNDFRVLTKVPCTFATIDYNRKNPAYYETRKTVIEVDCDDQVVAVHFNTGLDSTVRVREDLIENYYRAHKKLWKIITRPELRFTHRMRPGDLLVFNNRRVAHGREAFVPNGGIRLLQSTYVNVEDVRSKYMVLGHQLGTEVTPTKIGNRSCI